MTRNLPKGDLVDRLRRFCFHLLRYPSYGALTSTPAGLSPAEHASLNWTHNRACGFPAHGFPTGFTSQLSAADRCKRFVAEASGALRMHLGVHLRLEIQLSLKVPDFIGCLQAHRQSPTQSSSPSKAHQKSGPFPPPALHRLHRSYDPVRLPCRPTPVSAVEAATLARHGPPPITRLTLPTCRAQYPDGPKRVRLSVASPFHSGLPRISGGSASMTSLSRPAQALLALRPAGLLNRPRRPLSRGFDPAGYPTEPLVSYQVLPTTSWVDPSSTGEPRRWGALRNAG
jgi:hypothetical protein